MRCGRCGRENPDDVTFCLDCGFKLHAGAAVVKRPEAPGLSAPDAPSAVALVACPICQTQNQVGHRFCVTCGGTLPVPASSGPHPGAPRPTLDARAMSPDFANTVPVNEARISPFASPATAAAMAALGATQVLPPNAPPSSGHHGGAGVSSGPPTAHETPMAIRASSHPPDAGAPVTPGATPPLVAAPMVAVEPTPPPPAAASEPCPRCGSPSTGGALFCKVCGLALKLRPTETLASVPEQHRPSAEPAAGVQVVAAPPFVSPSGSQYAAVGATAPTAPISQRLYGRMVRVEKDGTDGASLSLSVDRLDLGARDGEIILSDDPYIAPRHARLQREPNGEVFLTDLGTLNGIYRKLREPHPLTDGDLILLGQQVLRFEPVTDAEQGLLPAMQHGVALFGTSPRGRQARLSQRTVEGTVRDVFHLHRDETSLGRETADIVFTDDPFLSRRHAMVRRASNGAYSIEDLASSNGTFVTIRGRMRVRSGDIVRLGLHVFRFDLVEAGQGAPS